MSDLKRKLIRLGYTNPDLRLHLKPVVYHLEKIAGTNRDSAWNVPHFVDEDDDEFFDEFGEFDFNAYDEAGYHKIEALPTVADAKLTIKKALGPRYELVHKFKYDRPPILWRDLQRLQITYIAHADRTSHIYFSFETVEGGRVTLDKTISKVRVFNADERLVGDVDFFEEGLDALTTLVAAARRGTRTARSVFASENLPLVVEAEAAIKKALGSRYTLELERDYRRSDISRETLRRADATHIAHVGHTRHLLFSFMTPEGQPGTEGYQDLDTISIYNAEGRYLGGVDFFEADLDALTALVAAARRGTRMAGMDRATITRIANSPRVKTLVQEVGRGECTVTVKVSWESSGGPVDYLSKKSEKAITGKARKILSALLKLQRNDPDVDFETTSDLIVAASSRHLEFSRSVYVFADFDMLLEALHLEGVDFEEVR